MTNNKKRLPPVSLIVLEVIGTILTGLGLAEKFANVGIVPEAYHFQDYEIVMIVIGAILLTPFAVWTISQGKNN